MALTWPQIVGPLDARARNVGGYDLKKLKSMPSTRSLALCFSRIFSV